MQLFRRTLYYLFPLVLLMAMIAVTGARPAPCDQDDVADPAEPSAANTNDFSDDEGMSYTAELCSEESLTGHYCSL